MSQSALLRETERILHHYIPLTKALGMPQKSDIAFSGTRAVLF
jgi:hypothetical protein